MEAGKYWDSLHVTCCGSYLRTAHFGVCIVTVWPVFRYFRFQQFRMEDLIFIAVVLLQSVVLWDMMQHCWVSSLWQFQGSWAAAH